MTNKDIHAAFKNIQALEETIAVEHDDKLINKLLEQRNGAINVLIDILGTNRMEFKEWYEKWSGENVTSLDKRRKRIPK